VRDVCDVNTELKAAVRKDVDVYRIIKISSGCRIDGDCVAAAKVVPPLQIAFTNGIRQRGCFSLHVLRKICGQPEFLDDDQRLDVGIVQKPDDADDLACRPVCRSWKPRDFNLDDAVLVF
jgi:hypothetical protein